jgi:GT2 family glycosyltransferase
VPRLAAHQDNHALSPTIDWSTLIKDEAEDIEIENTRRRIDSYAHVRSPEIEAGDMSSTKPLLSILVLTHNDSNKFLDGCLGSIPENVSCPYEVILLDNGSTENICEEFARQYPWIRLIRSEKNLGFNAGNNLAARCARGKHILLLNVDTILLTDVAPAVRLLESNHGIGVVGAQAYSPSHEVRPSAGRFPRAWRLWLFRSLLLRPRVRYGPEEFHAYKVDWVEGSFFMTSAENWAAVGGFEEQNPLYGNDVDFCQAMLARGLAAVQCADAKYIHYGGFGVSRMKYLYAGFRQYHEKFSSRTERFAANLVLRAGLIARIFVYGFWCRMTKNKKIEEKLSQFIDIHNTWAKRVA